jgi:hypothetical protein
LSRIGEDGRTWLRRPELCTESCRAILRRRSDEYVINLFVCIYEVRIGT